MTIFPARVLVGVDVGEPSDHAVDVANEVCLRTESELHLAHVKLTSPSMRGRPMGPAQQEKLDEEAKVFLRKHVDRLEEAGGRVAGTHVRFSTRIEDALVAIQAELEIGLIVVGARTSGDLARRLIGSLPPVSSEATPASVLVARGIAGA